MANEYLQRTPTSTGNRRVGTISAWYKINNSSSGGHTIFSSGYNTGSTNKDQIDLTITGGPYYWQFEQYGYPTAGGSLTNYYSRNQSYFLRDYSSWSHILVAFDTTQITAQDRAKVFINGVRIDNSTSSNSYAQNYQFPIGALTNGLGIKIGNGVGALQYGSTYYPGELCDYFYIDGQALTPDVFGFYKTGKGYISVGSTQSTDFRPGQWVPKTPRVIKTTINNNGGFGVNGFYLPMNDSKNFGADFHCDPNSIITLNEKLPQPRVGVATTASAGIGYTDALRADPYAANLVLALPFVSGGLNSGFGDYSAAIKGSGSAKTITNSGVSIASTASYYGSSAQFNGSHYLTIPTNTDFDFGTGDFTIEYWANYQTLSPALSDTIMGGTSTGCFGVYMSTSQWGFVSQNQAAIQLSSGTIVGINQFNHFAVVRKGNTLTGYLNGVAGAASTTWTYSMTNTGLGIGAQNNGNNKITGYLQDLRIYKGVAKYTGGFDVPRPYTPVGIATWRAVPDTTANNFATWNAIDKGGSLVLTDGNLSITNGSSYSGVRGTIGIPATGKWYFEHREQSTAGSNVIGSLGISTNNHTITGNAAYDNFCGWYWGSVGKQIYINGSNPSSSWMTGYIGSGSILQVAYDADSKKIWFGQDGTYYRWVSGTTLTGDGNPSNGTNQSGIVTSNFNLLPYNNAYATTSQTNFGQNPTFSGNTTAGTFTDTNGKGLFKYQPPSGFLALCEDNLPTPAIANPGRHFRTVLYTGDGNSGRSIVGVGFTPDLVWSKCRNTSVNGFNIVRDSIRGSDNRLITDGTYIEGSDTTYGSFNNDGFSLGSNLNINTNGNTYVAWCWRAGAGTTSTNTNGSITSVVSVNQDAGFSIVSYTGNGSNPTTVGHGLGKVPKFIIFKRRNSAVNWFVYHGFNSSGAFEGLNTTNAYNSALTLFNQTAPTSSVINLGNTDSNASGGTYIAYCWAEIEGYSKFGSYTGNGSTDGPFVYCGFKPAWVMIKRTDSTGNWCMHDSSRSGGINVMNEQLQANLSNAESGTGGLIDFLSNGFKIRGTSTDLNASGGTYIFAAYAESPFTTANAK